MSLSVSNTGPAPFNKSVAQGAEGSLPTHVVQRGDTLSRIAQANGVSLSALLAVNPGIRNPDLIYPDQRINLPERQQPQGSTGASGSTEPAANTSGGGLTAAQLQQIVPGMSAERAAQVAPHLNSAMAEADISTPQRQAMFIAQLAHESGGFRYMEEIASGAAYEGRADLGNTQPGDGERFKGRGYIQLTGRSNYESAGRALGLDLVNNPELAARPENAARVAAWYWGSRNINDAADAGDFVQVTRLINGGTNGLADRQAYFERATAAIGDGVDTGSPAPGQPGPGTPDPSPSPGTGGSYTVRSGDTLSGIAQRQGVSLDALVRANPQITNINLIYAGQRIALPGDAQAAGGAYTVRAGDTLSGIAQGHGVSLTALVRANPQITNPDLIQIGQRVNIPSGGATQAADATSGPAPADRPSGSSPAAGNPAAIAERFLDWNAGDLKVSGQLPMDPSVPNNVNCANFVTAVLQEAGAISWHDNTVAGTRDRLIADGWQRVDLSNARPGDVVVMDRNGQSHVVFFHSFAEDGSPQFIGSNNRNADNSQRVTWGGASGSYFLLTPPR